jgi:hypothetical protein
VATCEFSGACSFFTEEFEGIPHIANLLHKAFCYSHFTTCERYKIALSKGVDAVPHDLLPDGLKGSSAERRQSSRQDKLSVSACMKNT